MLRIYLFKLTFVSSLFSVMGLPSIALPAQLTPQDASALTQHLNIIAADPDWPQASVNAANDILSKPAYDAAAWNTYFQTYFQSNRFTERLDNYLQYPIFHWFDEPMHVRLQQGITPALLATRVPTSWNAVIAGPPNLLAQDAGLRNDLYSTQNMLTRLATSPTLQAHPSTKWQIYDTFTSLINQHGSVLRSNVSLNRSSHPYLSALRTQSHYVLIGSAPNSTSNRLDLSTQTKTAITNTLGLSGTRAAIWQDHMVLLEENNLSSLAQQQQVYDLLSLIPASLHNTSGITINEFLGNTTPYQSQSLGLRAPYDGVNIFEFGVGTFPENSFPPDVSPKMIDVFTATLAHEINHVVDVVSVNGNPIMASRKQQLLTAAGSDPQNYLRSMFPPGFFQDSPQEFIASISNQWFTDSEKTVELGLRRFDSGRRDPVNQALFLAEIYSQGTDQTYFYRIDSNGKMARWNVPLNRNPDGAITRMRSNGNVYNFTIDSAGNTTAYSMVVTADLNGDEAIDGLDLGIVFSNWGDIGWGDISRDGIVDGADVAMVYSRWTGDTTAVTNLPEPSPLLATCLGIILVWHRRTYGPPLSTLSGRK